MNKLKLFVKKGDILKCWYCKEKVYEFTQDRYDYDIISANDLKPINKKIKQPLPGDKMICPICGCNLCKEYVGNFNIERTAQKL